MIATYSLPPEDWRKTRVFGWMAAFLHFDKLLQLPMMVACELGGLSYCDIIDAFLEAPEEEYPVIHSVRDVLRARSALDAAGRAGIRLFEGVAGHLLAGRRIHVHPAHRRPNSSRPSTRRPAGCCPACSTQSSAAARSRGEGGDRAQCRADVAAVPARRHHGAHALQYPRILRRPPQGRAGRRCAKRLRGSRSSAASPTIPTCSTGAARSCGGATRKAPISTSTGTSRLSRSSPDISETSRDQALALSAARLQRHSTSPSSASAHGASAGARPARHPMARPTMPCRAARCTRPSIAASPSTIRPASTATATARN